MSRPTTIRIHTLAPRPPGLGAPCNGCGACCLAEPCPVGILVSRRRRGACLALRWDAMALRYICAVVTAPNEVLGWGRGRAARWWARPLRALARRWIAVGAGCDSSAVAEPAAR